MRRALAGIVCLMGACMVLPGPAVAAASSASTPACHAVAHHVDAAHSGFSCTTLPSTLTKKWSVTLNGTSSYPIIARGKVFVTTSNSGSGYGGWLYALNATDGTVAWGPVPLAGTYYYFPLAFDRGRVFVNDFDGTVRAFDAASGVQEWAQETSYFSGEPVAYKGVVWLHGASSVFGLSETTGHIVATSYSLDGDGSAPAADHTGVYVSAGCESQYKLSLTGSIVWQDHTGCSGGGAGSVALWGDRMYGGNGNVVVRKRTGKILSTFAGTPAFGGSAGFFGVDNAVYAQDVQTGVPMWTTFLSGDVLAGPVATAGGVYVGTSAPEVVVLDPVTGDVLSSIALPDQPGGGGQYSGSLSDLAAGDSILVVPTGAIVTAFD